MSKHKDRLQFPPIAIDCTTVHAFHGAINCTAGMHQNVGPSVRLRNLVDHSISEASKRAYQSDLTHFRARGGTIPSSPDAIAEYVAVMADEFKPATIARRLVSIGKAHRMTGHENPCQSEIVKATVRGLRRTKGIAQRQARALLRDDLFAILDGLGDRAKDVRDRALLLLGFAGAFRRSELVGLDVADIEHVRQGIVVHLRRSKTDQAGAGRKIAIPFGRTRWCPIQHLTEWFGHAGIEDGPIFRPINRHGHVGNRRLSGEAVCVVVKQRADAAGFDPGAYSGHSLRAGLATSAATAGASAFKIRAQTGHASEAMLARYIRDGDMFTDNAAARVL